MSNNEYECTVGIYQHKLDKINERARSHEIIIEEEARDIASGYGRPEEKEGESGRMGGRGEGTNRRSLPVAMNLSVLSISCVLSLCIRRLYTDHHGEKRGAMGEWGLRRGEDGNY